jgi:hypothetical protein
VAQNELVEAPLYNLPFDELCPGNAELQRLQSRFR